MLNLMHPQMPEATTNKFNKKIEFEFEISCIKQTLVWKTFLQDDLNEIGKIYGKT